MKDRNKAFIHKFESPYWVVQTDELSKYHPSGYNNENVFCEQTWTSMWDIGKTYNGEVFNKSVYMNIEDLYVNAIVEIFKLAGCKYINLGYLGEQKINLSDVRKSPLMDSDLELYSKWKNIFQYRTRIAIAELDIIIRLCLREWINVRLVNVQKNIYVMFGYDYYVGVLSNIDYINLIKIVKHYNLYLNARSANISQNLYLYWKEQILKAMVHDRLKTLDIPTKLDDNHFAIETLKNYCLMISRILRVYRIKKECHILIRKKQKIESTRKIDAIIRIENKKTPQQSHKIEIGKNDLFQCYEDKNYIYICMPTHKNINN